MRISLAALAALGALVLGACSDRIFDFGPECESDADCGEGRVCDTSAWFNRCALPCECDSECKDTEICVSNQPDGPHQAVCTKGCRSDADCAEEGLLCIDQRCQKSSCYRDDQCGEGEFCDRFNRCSERECERSDDCDEGFVCDGRCVAGCFSDDDCPGGQGCMNQGWGKGVCTPSACIGDEDCTGNLSCLCGRCVEHCESDEECADGRLCTIAIDACTPRICERSGESCNDQPCPEISVNDDIGGLLEACCVKGHGGDTCGFRYRSNLIGHHSCGIPIQTSTECECEIGECCLPDGSCGRMMKPLGADFDSFALCSPKSPAESESCEPS